MLFYWTRSWICLVEFEKLNMMHENKAQCFCVVLFSLGAMTLAFRLMDDDYRDGSRRYGVLYRLFHFNLTAFSVHYMVYLTAFSHEWLNRREHLSPLWCSDPARGVECHCVWVLMFMSIPVGYRVVRPYNTFVCNLPNLTLSICPVQCPLPWHSN